MLLIVVGGALMAFILTDLFSSRNSVFGSDFENIGTIDGHDIRGIDFNNRYEKELENYKTRENTSDVPEYVQGQLREQVWNQYLNELLIGNQLEELGITVSVEELGDMAYGDDPHPQVKQAFTNPETGVFNKNDVINFLKNMERDESGKTKNQWLVFEKAIKEERRLNKYYAMINKGLYATDFEAKERWVSQNRQYSISFVQKRYNEIADSSITIDESDIKEYYNEHQNKFKEKKSRKIAYAMFNVLPSSEDSAFIEKWVNETYESFKLTEDDSAFVNANSDREFDFRFYSVNDENTELDSILFKQDSAGFMLKPEIDGESWKMVKISKIKTAPDSVQARHILLDYNDKNKEEVDVLVDSIKTALEGGADFTEMAAKYSVDPGSKDKGGELGWFKEGFMIPVINKACFEGELNKVQTIESAFGMHIIEVTGKSEEVKKIQVGIIYRELDASKETVDQQFTASNNFSIQLEAEGDLVEMAREQGIPYNLIDIKENDNMIPEIESSRGLIRWAFNAEIGQVSEALQYGGTFVVAKLEEIHEDGIAPLERVRLQAENGAIKDKKAEMFMEEMSGFTDLESAASSLNTTVEKVANILFDAYSAPMLGREPNVLGKIFTMNVGDLSIPIKGESGVFIVQIDNIMEAPEMQNALEMKQQLMQERSSRVSFSVFEALKERVEIEDNRYKIY